MERNDWLMVGALVLGGLMYFGPMVAKAKQDALEKEIGFVADNPLAEFGGIPSTPRTYEEGVADGHLQAAKIYYDNWKLVGTIVGQPQVIAILPTLDWCETIRLSVVNDPGHDERIASYACLGANP